MAKKIFFLIVVAFALISLQAKPRKKIAENLPLHNTKWMLEKILNNYIFSFSDTAYIVFYENYTFRGNFGCNLFFGEFSFGKKRIKLDYLGATKQFCTDMNVEEQFFKAIKNDITHYYIEKNKLYLLSKFTVICMFDGLKE
jgi:heat shock protein HslJ